MGKITWIQLSDLHFGDDSEYSRTSRDSLLEYIQSKSWDIDYLFITGDLIFAKKANSDTKRKDAYKAAFEYIQKLYRVVWREEDNSHLLERIFIVPGNHDVIRSKSRNASINGIKNDYKTDGYNKIDKSFLNAVHQGLEAYYDFIQMFGEEEVKKRKEKIHFVTTTEKINVLHLNSCIASGEDQEEGSLIMGFDLLSKALDGIDKNLPTIALAHHNIECLDWKEQKKIEILLKNNKVILYLCGHTHERESNIVLRYDQSTILSTFTSGTLMADGTNGLIDTVFFRGELDHELSEGKIYSYKWSFENKWHEDKDFGLVQKERQENFRYFRAGSIDTYYSPLKDEINEDSFFEEREKRNQEGVISKIVPHISPERTRAFTDINERAEQSLSVYGIGITHVSKDKDLMKNILQSGGVVKLCMMDPDVFKKDICDHLIVDNKTLSNVTIKVENCDIDRLNFCIGSAHMDNYIREEYAEDVKKSYDRIMKFKDEIKKKKWNLQVRVLRSFVPISINIINEGLDDKAELIAEYNMPFVEKRLLLQLAKKQNMNYYSELYRVFDKIWEQSIEV